MQLFVLAQFSWGFLRPTSKRYTWKILVENMYDIEMTFSYTKNDSSLGLSVSTT